LCVQNELKFTYAHLITSKNFRGFTPDPLTRGRGGKGRRAKEGQGEEGGEGRERNDEGRGGENVTGGQGREGRERDRKGFQLGTLGDYHKRTRGIV
jgi:hypothetical protein